MWWIAQRNRFHNRRDFQQLYGYVAFLANMSHELRTPMNGIVGMTTLARLRMTDPTRIKQIDQALSSAEDLLLLINRILEFSKLESEKLNLEQSELSSQSLLDPIVELARTRVKK